MIYLEEERYIFKGRYKVLLDFYKNLVVYNLFVVEVCELLVLIFMSEILEWFVFVFG